MIPYGRQHIDETDIAGGFALLLREQWPTRGLTS